MSFPDFDAVQADQGGEIVAVASLFIAILIGDALVIYRLWIIWMGNWPVMIFPLCTLTGVAVTSTGIAYEFIHTKSSTHRETALSDNKAFNLWVAIGFVLSLLNCFYCTGMRLPL
ncbi:hypothetical protein MVEN_02174400 [Mycena venus]|uniref:Uncharacterized protein n=1 Tax=Mycena venus TaxID=2733690 RepID=A0A8H6X886_9AGAR|nr:hypothetical protein MVEN_02174400 [Mycena venus]